MELIALSQHITVATPRFRSLTGEYNPSKSSQGSIDAVEGLKAARLQYSQ
jgi:hypothetical protein